MFRINRNGVTRLVITTKNYAIKFPRVNYGWMKFIEGIHCNLSEKVCWDITKSKDLCPVIFSFLGIIMVMPRVEVCKNENEILSIPLVPGEDRKHSNYGVYNGNLVCIDYPYHRIKLNNKLKTSSSVLADRIADELKIFGFNKETDHEFDCKCRLCFVSNLENVINNIENE